MHAQMMIIDVGLSATGGKISLIIYYGVQQRKKAIHLLEEGTPVAAAAYCFKIESLVLFSTIWSVTDSRSRDEIVNHPAMVFCLTQKPY